MRDIKELEVGMNVMFVGKGDYLDSGEVIEIRSNEIVMGEKDETFTICLDEVDGFFELD